MLHFQVLGHIAKYKPITSRAYSFKASLWILSALACELVYLNRERSPVRSRINGISFLSTCCIFCAIQETPQAHLTGSTWPLSNCRGSRDQLAASLPGNSIRSVLKAEFNL